MPRTTTRIGVRECHPPWLVGLLAGLLIACTGSGSDRDASGEWRLDAIIGTDSRQQAAVAAVLVIDGGSVTGTDGCGNDIRAELGGGHISPEGFHTLVGCLDDEANDQAGFVWAVLGADPTIDVENEILRLRSANGEGLDFVRPSP